MGESPGRLRVVVSGGLGRERNLIESLLRIRLVLLAQARDENAEAEPFVQGQNVRLFHRGLLVEPCFFPVFLAQKSVAPMDPAVGRRVDHGSFEELDRLVIFSLFEQNAAAKIERMRAERRTLFRLC